MFFANKLKGKAATKRKVNVKLNFSKTNGDFARCKNVKRQGNGVASTFGLLQTFHGLAITKAVFKHGAYTVILTREMGLFSFNGRRPYNTIATASADSVVGYVQYQDADVFSCDSGTYYTNDGMNATQISTEYYYSLAKCYDRVIGVNGNKLSMTEAGNVTAWDDSREITAHTPLNAVVALDKVYALGDTCYFLTMDAEEKNMKFAPFAYGIGTVQTESVATIANSALFASTNGLYQLKANNTVTQIFCELYPYVSFDGCVACAHNGYYYVACKRRHGEPVCNDILLVLDVDSEQIVAVLDVEAQHVNVLDNLLYVVSNDNIYYEYKISADSSFYQKVDFGIPGVKYLDSLSIKSRTDAEVWIDNGSEKRRYTIRGKNAVQHLPIGGWGNEFAVEVQSYGNLQLDVLSLTAHSYEV